MSQLPNVLPARANTATCIIVCYRPDDLQTLDLCKRLLAEDAKVIIVDNTENPYLEIGNLSADCKLIRLGYNSGIAHAQNRGVQEAMRDGAAALVFFDQDSIVDSGFLRNLLAALTLGIPNVVAPLCIDIDSGRILPSFRINRYGFIRSIDNPDVRMPYPVDIVISSGTAVTREAFLLGGPFDESLFIDFVDTEWCLRYRSKKIPIHIAPSALMHHQIGKRAIRIGPFTILVHPPARCYYQIRNCFLIMGRAHVPFIFPWMRLLSLACSRGLLLFFVRNRRNYIHAYLLGFWHGIRRISGIKSD